jgi:hypothetical protein
VLAIGSPRCELLDPSAVHKLHGAICYLDDDAQGRACASFVSFYFGASAVRREGGCKLMTMLRLLLMSQVFRTVEELRDGAISIFRNAPWRDVDAPDVGAPADIARVVAAADRFAAFAAHMHVIVTSSDPS